MTTAVGTEDAVVKDIEDRQALGIKKYGTTVSDNPLPLRAWLQHAYEETLDKAVYLKRAIEEMDRVGAPWGVGVAPGSPQAAQTPHSWAGHPGAPPLPSYKGLPRPLAEDFCDRNDWARAVTMWTRDNQLMPPPGTPEHP